MGSKPNNNKEVIIKTSNNDDYNSIKKRIIRKINNAQNNSNIYEDNHSRNKEKHHSKKDPRDKHNPYLQNNSKLNTYNFDNKASNRNRDLEMSKNSYPNPESQMNTDR